MLQRCLQGLLWAMMLGYSLSAGALAAQPDALCVQLTSTASHCHQFHDYLHYLTQQHHFSVPALRALFEQVNVSPDVLKKLQQPYEQAPWYRYQSHFISPERVRQGVRFWQSHQPALSACEHAFGLPANIVTAILGVESDYGQVRMPYRAIDVLTCIAFSDMQRAPYFKKELTALLLLAREQHHSALHYPSSYAGAMGMPQFMPSSYRHYAIANPAPQGYIDLAHDPQAAIASIGYYLSHFGWQAQAPVALHLNTNLTQRMPQHCIKRVHLHAHAQRIAQLQTWVTPWEWAMLTVYPPYYLFTVAGIDDTEYWIGFKNFRAIMHYNGSINYVMAVAALAQRIADGQAAHLPFPALVLK